MNSSALADFPRGRPRRLRENPALRAVLAECRLNPASFILPLFVRPGQKIRHPIDPMPGHFQVSPDEAVRSAAQAAESGVGGVIIFGIPSRKDAKASEAYAARGIVQQTVRKLKKEVPSLLVVTDVCLCEYMSHGHCGVTERVGNQARVRNDPSLSLLARTALSHAEAGADLVAPSDMMDGRVSAIRDRLDHHGFEHLPIMSYAVKFASSFYGPFREAAESAPQFGDRRTYQMDPANAREAMREAALDLREGADIILVKPALAYLDIVRGVKDRFECPTAAYSVSAEYAMVKAAAARGWIDERAVVLESLLCLKRAGADLIITYSACEAARWLRSE